MGQLLEEDRRRYADGGHMPAFQYWLRRSQETKSGILRKGCRALYNLCCRNPLIDISVHTQIGGGLYIGHPCCININPDTVIGRNVNIHRGVVLGQVNRGPRRGAPVIGDDVWIGVNAAVVGHVVIGNDVLIAANAYVNCDVPPHSVVVGNPCTIHRREPSEGHENPATEGYINRRA